MRTVIPIKLVGSQDLDREADGWERVSTLAEPLLVKMVNTYRALGYEIDIRDMQRNPGTCTTCFDAGGKMGEVFGTLFVRRAASAAREDDQFFDEE